MSPYYNQNYTREQIDVILNKIKDCVVNRRFTISMNEFRQENVDFINEYNIRSKHQSSILLNIQIEDFCHSLMNVNPGFEGGYCYE